MGNMVTSSLKLYWGDRRDSLQKDGHHNTHLTNIMWCHSCLFWTFVSPPRWVITCLKAEASVSSQDTLSINSCWMNVSLDISNEHSWRAHAAGLVHTLSYKSSQRLDWGHTTIILQTLWPRKGPWAAAGWWWNDLLAPVLSCLGRDARGRGEASTEEVDLRAGSATVNPR